MTNLLIPLVRELSDRIDKLEERITTLETVPMSTFELVETILTDDARSRHLASNPATSSEDSSE